MNLIKRIKMSVVFAQDLSFSYVPKVTSYIMSHPNETSKHILSHGIFESPLIVWALENFKNSEKIFLDIGAHMGTYTLNFAPHFKHTYAFEAQKNTYYCLAGGIALNNLSSKATAYNYAITNSEDAGTPITLNVVSKDGGGSTIKKFDTYPEALDVEEVDTECIDHFEFEDVGLIKIDVEGAELDVIKGAVKTIKANNFPPILFEVWPDEWYSAQKEELITFVNELGYKTQHVYGNNMFLASV